MPHVILTKDWNDWPAGCDLEVSDEVAATILEAGACEGEAKVKPPRRTAKRKATAHGVDETGE